MDLEENRFDGPDGTCSCLRPLLGVAGPGRDKTYTLRLLDWTDAVDEGHNRRLQHSK
jgi:hypothetical protein